MSGFRAPLAVTSNSSIQRGCRKFLYLSSKSVLALQGIAGFTFGNTPFRKLEELGGADMMRGYYGGRFTDKCLMAYQAEYRRLLFWRIGMVAFAATGEVAPAACGLFS
jgi:hypothetical protein